MTAQEQAFPTRTFAELRGMELFDGLSDAKLRRLLDSSDEVDFVAGDVLWTERAPAVIWWVLLEGQLEMVRHVGRERVVFGSFTHAGQWGEGWAAFDPDGVYLVSGHATTAGRILRVPVASLRALAEDVPVIRHVLDGLFHTAREIETMTRQREALVALGTLAAGLAHELNNPAAAAVRAATSLEEAMRDGRAAMRVLTERGLSSAQLSALDALLDEGPASTSATDAMAVADREEALSAWMSGHGVERDWVLAPALAAAGFEPEWCDRVLAVTGEAALQSALEWLAASRASLALLAEVKLSIERVSGLVHSAKSYSQMDRGSFQRVDIREGLDSTLTVLAHVLGPAVIVEREYAADVPQIDGYPGELNQVWTSLISNAVDAMRGRGVLAVSLSTSRDRVLVTLTDSGIGMPPEVLDRAFDPFFTTKEVGKGSGLGLALARRVIVERHGGDITIDSEPGRTVVRVSLPITSATPSRQQG